MTHLERVHTKGKRHAIEIPLGDVFVQCMFLRQDETPLSPSEKYAAHMDVTAIMMEQRKDCDIRAMKEKFLAMQYSIGMQNNSAYDEPISSA